MHLGFRKLLQCWAVKRGGELFLVGLVELAWEHLMACRNSQLLHFIALC